jgi:hypothetical protein
MADITSVLTRMTDRQRTVIEAQKAISEKIESERRASSQAEKALPDQTVTQPPTVPVLPAASQ